MDDRGATATAGADEKPTEAAPRRRRGSASRTRRHRREKIDVGTVAAIGVAVGGIATFFSSILATVLRPRHVDAARRSRRCCSPSPGPSMLIAWLKLRQRNIGPILDANGWAVNARARINVPFGAALTDVATLPDGRRALAQRSLRREEAARGASTCSSSSSRPSRSPGSSASSTPTSPIASRTSVLLHRTPPTASAPAASAPGASDATPWSLGERPQPAARRSRGTDSSSPSTT